MIIKSKRHPDHKNVLKHVVLPIDQSWKCPPLDAGMFAGYTGDITADFSAIKGGNIWDDYTYTDSFMSFFSHKQILQLYGLVESDRELEDHLKSIGL